MCAPPITTTVATASAIAEQRSRTHGPRARPQAIAEGGSFGKSAAEGHMDVPRHMQHEPAPGSGCASEAAVCVNCSESSQSPRGSSSWVVLFSASRERRRALQTKGRLEGPTAGEAVSREKSTPNRPNTGEACQWPT